MKLLEKIVGVAALTASSLLGSGCGGGHKRSPPELYLTDQEIELTNRLVETQLANGEWRQEQIWYEPVDPLSTEPKTVPGIPALALLEAHRVDLYDNNDSNTTSVPGALQKSKDAIYQKMEDLNNNNTANVYPANFLFMKEYDKQFGLTQEEKDSVENAWDKLLWRWDMQFGSDPAVQVDGLYNRTYMGLWMQGNEALMGIHGAYMLRAAIAMDETPTNIGWLLNELRIAPRDTELENSSGGMSGISAIGHTLYALNEAGDTSMNAQLLGELNSKRNSDGSYGPNSEGLVLRTNYALMALKEMKNPGAVQTQSWLEDQVKSGGLIYDPTTDIERPQSSGLVLYSLLQNRDRKP